MSGPLHLAFVYPLHHLFTLDFSSFVYSFHHLHLSCFTGSVINYLPCVRFHCAAFRYFFSSSPHLCFSAPLLFFITPHTSRRFCYSLPKNIVTHSASVISFIIFYCTRGLTVGFPLIIDGSPFTFILSLLLFPSSSHLALT